MSDIALRVKELSKRYVIGVAKRRHDTLRDQFATSLKGLFRRNGRPSSSKHADSTFWALKNVSFEVKQGDVVGIIGKNGAGKSTLLKILSRITEPTEGRAEISGRLASLLEVGTGFHRELTGRENIYLNGAILGMKKREIDRKFDEIVDFSEVEKFIETPVKHYSSGMYVRLAFAVAAHLEPEVLIVDEVLAVGDVAFQRKCLGKMDAVAKQGRTVMFVSHNIAAIRKLCSRAILLNHGQIELAGTAEDVVQQYLSMLEPDESDGPSLGERKDRSGDGIVRAVGFEAKVPDTYGGGSPRTGAPVEFVIEYYVRQEPVRRLYAGITVTDSSGMDIFTCSTSMVNADFYDVAGRGKFVCYLDYLPLKPGKYWVSIKLCEYTGPAHYRKADEVAHAAGFEVIEAGDSDLGDFAKSPVVLPHQWLRPSDSPARQENSLAEARKKMSGAR